MKKFGITLVATLLIGIFSAQAAEKVATTTENKNEVVTTLDTSTEYQTIRVATKVPTGLKDAVTNQLLYPQLAKNQNIEGQVYMRLTVDENYKVKIVAMNATTPLLGKYVTKQLASTYAKNPGCKPGQVYMMKINFDLLN